MPKTPFELFQNYLSLKLHFTRENYNYFTYGGKTNAKLESFAKRKDKYYFEKLSRKDDAEKILLSNVLDDPNKWIGEFFDSKATVEFEKVEQSLTYRFTQDLSLLLENFNDNFTVKGGQRPHLLKLYDQGLVCTHTMTILNMIVDYIPYWDKKITDTIVYPKTRLKIVKLQPFLSIDVKKFKKIAKDKFFLYK